MLFEADSPLPVLLALGAVVIGLSAALEPAIRPLIEAGQAPFALLLVAAAGLPAVINLVRFRRAPAGCVALPAAFCLWGAARLVGRPPVEQVVWLAAPNVLLLGVEWIGRPLMAWREAREALRRLETERDPQAVVALLDHPSVAVRAAAGRVFRGLDPAGATGAVEAAARSPAASTREAAHAALAALAAQGDDARARAVELTWRLATGEDPAVAAAAAARLAALERRPERAWEVLRAEATAPAARVAVAGGIAALPPVEDPAGWVAALVAVVGQEDAPDDVRAGALDVLGDASADDDADEGPWAALIEEAARGALVPDGAPTAELLWLLAEYGRADDAPVVARWAGDDLFARSVAAVEATAGIVARTERLGEALAPTRAALEAGRARVREVHPPGDNLLADRYVGRIEHLLTVLDEETEPSDAAG